LRKPEAVGRKTSLWDVGGLTLLELSRRLMGRFISDELLTRAAALSFYFLFALFPTILSLIALLGLFAQRQDLHARLAGHFGRLMPPSAFALVEGTIREISIHSSGWKLGLGLFLALWSGSGGMSCIMDALDRCFRVQESRPLWKRQMIAVGLTALISGLSFAALIIVLASGTLAEFVGARTGLSHATVTLWQLAEWPIALFFVLLSLALIYHMGPDARQPWHWLSPGSVVGVLVWVAASLVFRVYLHFFSTYGRSYGSLGAVMVLLLWLYITGLAILLGAEINAEIEQVHSQLKSPEAD
jgi:membrane protein